MCSIFGIAYQEGCELKDNKLMAALLTRLFREAESRGRDASGLAFVSAAQVNVIKKDLPASEFVDLPEYKETMDNYGGIFCDEYRRRPISILGHCRAQTQGTKRDNKNNHPIVRSEVVGVHNGMISNDYELFNRHANNFPRNALVDSEIIFALIEHYAKDGDIGRAIRKATSVLRGSMACAMIHVKQPHLLWLFRNSSPCTIYHFVESGFIMWASTEQQLINALADLDFGEIESIPFKQHEGVTIDLHRSKIRTFSV